MDITSDEHRGPLLSVVVPARNEAENLALLIGEIDAALQGRSFEIIVVDDGSTDATPDVIAGLRAAGAAHLRLVRHDASAGQSAAVRSGLWAASGLIVATIDGDGQNDPVYIPVLVDALNAAGPGFGIACGQRLKRKDGIIKRLASRFANWLRQKILKDGTRDTGCGLKALPRDVFRRLPYFDGWHRYLPALVLRDGLKVTHVDVIDRPRRFGKSNYGIFDRGLRGILDLFGVRWLKRRRKVVPRVTEARFDS